MYIGPNDPLNFIDMINSRKHLALFYYNKEYATKIKLQFIKNGLLKGQSCIYATEEEPEFVQNVMSENGIDVARFTKKGQLQIYQMADPFDGSEDAAEICKNTFDMMLARSKPPYTMVTRLVPSVKETRGITVELQLEEYFHNRFNEFEGSVLCPYDAEQLERKQQDMWFLRLMDSHHGTIFLPPFGPGWAFDFHQ